MSDGLITMNVGAMTMSDGMYACAVGLTTMNPEQMTNSFDTYASVV